MTFPQESGRLAHGAADKLGRQADSRKNGVNQVHPRRHLVGEEFLPVSRLDFRYSNLSGDPEQLIESDTRKSHIGRPRVILLTASTSYAPPPLPPLPHRHCAVTQSSPVQHNSPPAHRRRQTPNCRSHDWKYRDPPSHQSNLQSFLYFFDSLDRFTVKN